MAEQNAHDERDTADLAADDTADLAIDDATDLAAADTARSQAPAGQPTPAGRAVSPSSSPTPTFAATDRPARRARRLRWKPGITRPMMALSAASFALMVAGRRWLRVRNPRCGCRRQTQRGGDAAGIGAVV